MTLQTSTQLTVADKSLALIVLVLIGLTYLFFWQTRSTPTGELQLKVFVGAKHHSSHALHGHQIIKVHGKIGVSTLEIAHGKVRFLQSPCRQKYCVLAGWQSAAHPTAACLPNRVTLDVASAHPEFDAINY